MRRARGSDATADNEAASARQWGCVGAAARVRKVGEANLFDIGDETFRTT